MSELVALPTASEAPRCTDFAQSVRLDPGGTAIRADLLIAAELPLPWPKPVFAHESFRGVKAEADRAQCPTRVLAAVPQSGATLSVVTFARGEAEVVRREWQTDESGLRQTVLELVAGRTPRQAQPVSGDSAAEVWICTQGSHDVCCGSDGTRFANEVEHMWDDVVVRRVSHTGGHRFAPTAITLPDGRMWAHLDSTSLNSILTRTGAPAQLAARCRGWWGASPGPEQVAERCILQIDGWASESAPRSTEVLAVSGDVTTVRVRAGEGGVRSWIVDVKLGRQVPRISCRAPGGLPTKPGVEYFVLNMTEEQL